MATDASCDVRKQLLCIIECSICTDKYQDPRFLPCLHTYCFKCIKGFSGNKRPGDLVPCPQCRSEFTVPKNGLDGLLKNFFVEQLKDIVDKQTPANCDIHQNRAVALYCFDCQSAICYKCGLDLHKSHKCAEINDAVEEFREQLKHEGARMVQTVSKYRDLLDVQEERKSEFCSMIDEIEKEINERVERMKTDLDLEKHKLLQDLERQKKERLSQIQNVIENIQQRISSVESLVKYTEGFGNIGTATEIAQRMRGLHDMAGELTKPDNIHREIADLGSVKVKFEPTKQVARTDSLIEHVHWQHYDGKIVNPFVCIIRLNLFNNLFS